MNLPLAATIILLSLVSIHLSAQNKVKTHEGVEIGGIKQWIGAKSDDDSKPLLLFLHGGPGFSSRAYSKKFVKQLKKDFIVAQWDQRGTGITAAWGSSNDSLTIELMHSDTEEVVNYLLGKFNKKKLYLVGFSWGGFLGLHFAHKHPELLHAYISVSSMIHGDESERRTLELIREKAQQLNNTEALAEISKITIPFASWEELYFQRKWTAVLFDDKANIKQYPKSLFKEWSSKWMPVFLEASKVNYSQTVPEIHCPIYFFLSKNDLVANYSVTQQYFDDLAASRKQLIWFDQSTHEIPSQEPKKFSEELIKISRSLN
jgi:proline iminopeptidase